MRTTGVSPPKLAGSLLWPVCGAGLILFFSGCSSNNAIETFNVTGELRNNTYFSVYQDGTCRFPDGIYSPGEQVVLRGADNAILATSQLAKGPQSFPAEGLALCDLSFHFDKVKAGEKAYQITVGSGVPIVVTEQQLRNKEFNLEPRHAFSPSRGEPIITVNPPP